MQIIISGKNLTVSDALKARVEDRLNAILDYPNLKITSARVVMEVEKIRNIVDISVSMKNHTLEAKAETLNMYEAIDAAAAKIEAQISKLVDKVQDHGNKQPLRDIVKPNDEE